MTETATGLRIAVHTLGCKLNYSETTAITRQLVERGHTVVHGEDTPPDIFVINTCSVTENAERECRQLVRRALRSSPHTRVIVTGCYAQLRPEEIARIPGVSLVLGSSEKFKLDDHLTKLLDGPVSTVIACELGAEPEFHHADAAGGATERTRAFLKVQDGCDYSCSFCTIPQARGASRSPGISEIIDRARSISESGRHEIILTGVNVGDFGRTGGGSLIELMQALDRDDRITARIRVSSIEPNLLTDQLIAQIAASTKFCPHFHIPMQSGSPAILRMMQRRYQPELYRSRIELIRRLMPNAGIGADVIVGFPGETDALFEETLAFIASLEIDYLHVFTYSERPGTKAATMPDQVPVAIRRERNERLRQLSKTKHDAFLKRQVGRQLTVILEKGGDEQWRFGHTENYAKVRLKRAETRDAEIVQATVQEVSGELLSASVTKVLASRPAELLPIL